MKSITPFLMFQSSAREAIALYTEVFKDACVTELRHHGPEGPGEDGAVMLARLEVAGQAILILDSPTPHDFSFTPANSLFVETESEEEIRRLSDALAADGSVLMPLAKYDFSCLFTWIEDRFGVSWQLNLE